MEVDSISFIIEQIKECQKQGLTPAALYMALTLPDICGNLEFPLCDGNPYILWFDKYIGNYKQSPLAKEDPSCAEMPYMTGEKMYRIRNALLHAGTNDLKKRFKLDEFLFVWNGYLASSGIEYDFDGKRKKYWNVNVPMLIDKIVWSTEAFLKKAKYDKTKLPKMVEYGLDSISNVFK